MHSVVIGGTYRHYKGGEYRVLHIAKHSETKEEYVVYRLRYGDESVHMRLLSEFCEQVVIDGVTEPRFARQEGTASVDWLGYQRASRETAIYPNHGRNPIYPTLGLAGEAGEVANAIKKVWREHEGEVTPDERRAIADELGDVLWYLVQLATELHISLEDVALRNLAKTRERYSKH